jgi:2-C-methyl-D-erythritol 4-phosphate cytidylyltransferase
MKVVVLIPAAGLGTRMVSGAPSKRKPAPSKQFTELGGVPILLHTLRTFAANPRVSEIFVALRKDEIAGFRERLVEQAQDVLQKKVELVEGGEHRQHSVANALAAVKAEDDDIVLVHDAVRPFVTPEIINEVVHGVEKHGAAIAGMPAVDTVKMVDRKADGAHITATVPRERVVLAQTPQGFRYAILKKAFDAAQGEGFVGTDEASLVEHSGHDVFVVMGSPRNLKITTPADMELAEFYSKK